MKRPLIYTRSFDPAEELRPYIVNYLFTNIRVEQQADLKVRTFPFALTSMFIGLHNSRLRYYSNGKNDFAEQSATLMGIYPIESVSYLSPAQMETDTVNVTLTFQGLSRLIGLPLIEIHEMNVDLGDLMGADLNLLRTRLEHADNDTGMVRFLNDFFTRRLKIQKGFNNPVVSRMTRILNSSFEIQTVKGLAEEMNMHMRTLERNFREYIGLTPMEFLRIRRFILLKKLLANQPGIQWPDLIIRCGFYDQSHLNQEIRKVTDLSVKEFSQLVHTIG